MIRKYFSLKTVVGINFGLGSMCLTPDHISWITFTLDLISYTDKVFRWVQIVSLLKPICFYFAMKEIS